MKLNGGSKCSCPKKSRKNCRNCLEKLSKKRILEIGEEGLQILLGDVYEEVVVLDAPRREPLKEGSQFLSIY